VGGHAGGQKYIYHGILFKFATDWLKLYGSDEYAMYARILVIGPFFGSWCGVFTLVHRKAAGLELKGAMRYYLCEGLSVPLMALVRTMPASSLPLPKNVC
jgi:hypothetical protein